MSKDDNIISIRNVSKLFGQVAAVDDVSFDIARGEFFSLLGASGCGKTTLLRMLAGFEQPTAGDMLIDGQQMAGVPANHRPTNMVFQSYAIFPHLNVRENIGYGLRNTTLSKAEARTRVEDALELVKLSGLGERGAGQLSGGQRQRVALARALVRRPKVLLLDEPLSALDKKLREEMQIELRALQRTVGITFVFVTHDQEEALTLSDRIAVMSQGKVLQIDTASGLYEKPNCREVAAFIGTMNIFPGHLARISKAEGVVDAGALGKIRVSHPGDGLAQGQSLFFAIRPEKLTLQARAPAGNDQNSIAGDIIAISYRGDRSHFLVHAEGLEKPVAISQQNGADPAPHAMKSGDRVFIAWPKSAGLVLTR